MRLKIVHVITQLELGGAQQNTLYTVEHLDRERFDVYLASGPDGLLTEEAAQILGESFRIVPHLVRPIRPIADFLAYRELLSWFRTLNPDIVHTHSSKAGVLGRWAAYHAGVPVILHTIHGYGITPEQTAWLRRLLISVERRTSQITTHFLAVSQENIRWGLQHRLFSQEKVTLVRSGIDLSSFNVKPAPEVLENLRREFHLEQASHIIGMVACLKPQKAPLDFARVARHVIREKPEAHFVFIGDGQLRDILEKYIHRHGLKDRFHLVGWRRDVPQWMHLFDCLVLTSLWEGLPRVIPEAFAAGVPVVATAVDGIKDIIQHGRTGFLARPHDIQSLARYVLQVLHNPEQAQKMIEQARTILAEFDINRMVSKQVNIYETLYRPRPNQ